MQFFVWALGYYAGAHFILLGLTDFPGFFRCLMAIVLASRAGGFANVNAMDAVRGEAAKRHIFSLLDRPSSIDPLRPPAEGDRLSLPVAGRLEFRGVHFAYPSRPTEPVLRGLDLVVEPGEVRGCSHALMHAHALVHIPTSHAHTIAHAHAPLSLISHSDRRPCGQLRIGQVDDGRSVGALLCEYPLSAAAPVDPSR
jgi:hypothetical protein